MAITSILSVAYSLMILSVCQINWSSASFHVQYQHPRFPIQQENNRFNLLNEVLVKAHRVNEYIRSNIEFFYLTIF